MSGRSMDWRQWILPASLIACVVVMIVPIPAPLIDILLAANIALAVIILLTTLQVQSPLDFSLFPSVLLAATLGRLVLNISTTRLILSHGTDGAGAAGNIIESFGSYVVGQSLVIGAIIFSIIVVVQFVVVTKGATRVSEVAARFALDGMPGRQMAIDADLSAGMIDHGEANRRRESLTMQADFYGAMDGASKFVRGDAIAAIIITFINIGGGLWIGLSNNMSLGQAADTFTRLTIGEGLSCQIPAFLIAMATGILLTRNTKPTNLSTTFFQQLFGRPAVLMMAAVFLGLLVFTRLPALPLLSIAALCGLATFLQTRRASVADPTRDLAPAAPNPEDSDGRLEELLKVDLLEIEIGVNLIPLADPRRGGDLLKRIAFVRSEIAREIGIILPKIRIRDNLALPPADFRIKVSSMDVAGGTLLADQWLARPLELDARELDGVLVNPFAPAEGVWIEASQKDQATEAGYALSPATLVLTQHLKSAAIKHADLILTRDATRHLIDQVRRVSPAVVDELIPEHLKLADVQQVLQMLLREQISIRRLALILEALGDFASRTNNLVWLTEFVRQRLAPSICQAHCDRDGVIYAAQLPPATEDMIAARCRQEIDALVADFSLAETRAITAEVQSCIAPLVAQGKHPIVLVGQKIRPSVKRLTHATLPHLVVLSHSELTPEIQIRMVPAAHAA